MDVRVGLWRKLSAVELMLLKCGVGEDSWESHGLQGDQPVNCKGNQSWIFTGRTDVEAETPILWPPDEEIWLIGEDPDAGKDWRQEEKEMTEIEMVGWHHWLNGREFEQAPGVGGGQGSLACCSIQGCKVSDTTERLIWCDLMIFPLVIYGCDRWTIKKAECWRIDAFELWCWRRLLRVPWTVRDPTNQC